MGKCGVCEYVCTNEQDALFTGGVDIGKERYVATTITHNRNS